MTLQQQHQQHEQQVEQAHHGDGLGPGGPLSADAQGVAGIFHIAALEDLIVLAGQDGGAHVELAVRGVGLLGYLDGPAADVGNDRVLHVVHELDRFHAF